MIGALPAVNEGYVITLAGTAVASEYLKDGLVNAVHFELLWLKNKKEYYSVIEKEDDMRIKMLNDRWSVLKD